MPINRMNRLLASAPNERAERREEAAGPTVPAGFATCPSHLAVAQPWQQALYGWAYEQALATNIYRIIGARYRVLGLG